MPRAKLPYCDPDLMAPPELRRAVAAADVATVTRLLDDRPELVWADRLFLAVCRVPGYDGHGGEISREDAKEDARVDIAREFLRHGAHPSMRAKRKVTPLHGCARFDLPKVAELLLEAGGDPNATNVVRETPLYRAVNLGYHAVAEALLRHGGDPDIRNSKGQTPVDRAARHKRAELLSLLMAHSRA
ncbi:ankyrin repeat domain-containing protein [Candidatus Poribacteria bacterium]|jgi:ankyrin repeat protein|nr:ankyrin repeat domain-containing protein [Candidatus Poribacteria bacterium]MBT5534124.1 ankyrin repeat domain-containing protein [Candidatus Poribacteria bacterium]MBT5713671.1 ankyrin repeat domain-containing protein [Candidatus Poribacteria bacterium]MBT7101112.1 ankyrin repeat domain-containing protein [Candidatus Poribacteria bacterium]MBT7807248.1 ankyrin repeat domain-containing protein [Candidatus Poribacteria bacterium]